MLSLTMPLPAAPRWRERATSWPLLRIVLGLLMVLAPVVLTMALVQATLAKPWRMYWPPLLAAILCVLAYVQYVRRVERRAVPELARAGALRELGAGLGLGALLLALIMALLAACGAYTVTGTVDGAHAWHALLGPLTEQVMVAWFEELLFRAVLLRIIELSLGSVIALPLSALLFALAHLPNEHVTVLAVANTAVAGLMFGALYMLTRRLWLVVGLHFAWNFLSAAVFSVATSGHAATGLLQGHLSGPDWLSGGAYGVEASLVTLVALSLASLLALGVALRRGQLMAPRWRRAAAAAAAQAGAA